MKQHAVILNAIERDGLVLDRAYDGLRAVMRVEGVTLWVIASWGMGWEHVSVSLPDRCPTWGEMCAVKDIFWQRQECVMQLHPSEDEYVNCHPFCLHLWKPIDERIPRPPSIMVGPQGKGAIL